MKKLVLLLGVVASLNAFGQSTGNVTYLGQDENGFPIYKNLHPFESLSSKIGLAIASSGVTAFIVYVFTDRKKEKETPKVEEVIE